MVTSNNIFLQIATSLQSIIVIVIVVIIIIIMKYYIVVSGGVHIQFYFISVL